MILFGWYSFLIRAYMLEELGIKIEDPTQKNMQVEVRQKCFHLFWIPFFGIGKIYALRKDGELYNLSPELENAIKKHMVHKTPWYTYTGFLLIAVWFILFNINKKYDDYKWEKSLAELHATKRNILTNPIVNDEYTIQTEAIPNTFYARVADVKSDSVLLKIVKLEKRAWGDHEPEKISFRDEDLKFAPQWTTTQELLNATRIENYLCDDSLQLYLPELGGVIPFSIRQLRRDGKEYW